MRRFVSLIIIFIITSFFLCAGSGGKECEYDKVRIKKMPIAMQCWTFHRFSFFETLKKVKELGIKYLEAYPGQILDKNTPDVRFGHTMNEEQIEMVKQKLRPMIIMA